MDLTPLAFVEVAVAVATSLGLFAGCAEIRLLRRRRLAKTERSRLCGASIPR
jgi:hypothetical protein